MEDSTIDGALLGTAISALSAVVLFIVGQLISSVVAYRRRRAVAFGDVIEAFTEYAQMEISGPGFAPSTVRMLSSRSKMLLALGLEDRRIGFWVQGIETEIRTAASLDASTHTARVHRQREIEKYLAALNNTLLDIQSGRLTRHDLLLASGYFWARAQGADLSHEVEMEKVLRPERQGRWAAIFAAVIQDGVIRPFLRLKVWLGFDAPFGWEAEVDESKPTTSTAP